MLKQYQAEMQIVRQAGVKETSGYYALTNLFNEVGATLKPKVLAVPHPANKGLGIPDFGLFEKSQLKNGLPQTPPSRGAVEVKGPGTDLNTLAQSEQVKKYLAVHGQVLITNYDEFAVVLDQNGPTIVEFHRIEGNSKDDEQRVLLFLQRALSAQTTLTRPEDVARFLASYAQEARLTLEDPARTKSLAPLRESLEKGLGITFKDDKAEAFFRSTLVQTLFYGVFSSWVLWHEENPMRTDAFDWKSAGHNLHVPIIQELYQQLSSPVALGRLGITTYLQRAAETLNRVDRGTFFAQFEAGLAVQYFYEPFLQAFDPELRRQLGVWYTPLEIVKYQVERVHRLLIDELNIPQGLASEEVVVLDPCCGTGAYLVEVLKKIYEAQGGSALALSKLQKAAQNRVFGFELLPAPFVVAHLQIGLLLQQLGKPFAQQERAGIYLTNALTGWEPVEKPKDRLPFVELNEERDQADKVKQKKPILVILGNPPYNGYAGITVDEERELSDAYRQVQNPSVPAPQGQGLNDLYVRFFRMAERQITEGNDGAGGIVSFISNYSWLDGLSHTAMRERYLQAFDQIFIDNLNGDKYATGKRTPEGKPDPSVFSTPTSPVGIQVGTAIATLIKRKTKSNEPKVDYRDFWGTTKLSDIGNSATDPEVTNKYQRLNPSTPLGLPLKPRLTAQNYLNWTKIIDHLPSGFPGIQTKRDFFLISIDFEQLVERITNYFDSSFILPVNSNEYPSKNSNRFDATKIRNWLIERGLKRDFFKLHLYRPFDLRHIYWEQETKLVGEKVADSYKHVIAGNHFLGVAQRSRKGYDPAIYSRRVHSLHTMEWSVIQFPAFLTSGNAEGDIDLFAQCRWNLSPQAHAYLNRLGIDTADFPLDQAPAAQSQPAADLFFHALAVLHSPVYAQENDGALRQDWPRIPLQPDLPPEQLLPLLQSSAGLGRKLAALLDPETLFAPPSHLKTIRINADITIQGDQDLAVTAGWGHYGSGNAVMPAKGRIEETPQGLKIFLNKNVWLEGVPRPVWEYTLGGYQVIKKWLSYREREILNRNLKLEEAEYLEEMARRIAAILELHPTLDQNYEAWKG